MKNALTKLLFAMKNICSKKEQEKDYVLPSSLHQIDIIWFMENAPNIFKLLDNRIYKLLGEAIRKDSDYDKVIAARYFKEYSLELQDELEEYMKNPKIAVRKEQKQ